MVRARSLYALVRNHTPFHFTLTVFVIDFVYLSSPEVVWSGFVSRLLIPLVPPAFPISRNGALPSYEHYHTTSFRSSLHVASSGPNASVTLAPY